MHQFAYYDISPSFTSPVESALLALPVIGDPAPASILALAHYSRLRGIREFRRTTKFSWTNRISDKPAAIGALTGLYGVTFASLYVIRVGIGSTYRPRKYEASHMEEFALDLAIESGQFVEIPLLFDAPMGCYQKA